MGGKTSKCLCQGNREDRGPVGQAKVVLVLGSQWGDEGKGKLVDIITKEYELCARFNGGSNAGHTLVIEGQKFAFHLLPCGVMHPSCENVIGNGVVLHIPTLIAEIAELDAKIPNTLNRIWISDRAALLFDMHQQVDGLLESEKGNEAIGTTKRGIGPCYSSKALRNGLRVGDLMHWESFERHFRALVAHFTSKYPQLSVDIDSELVRYKGFADVLKTRIIDTSSFVHERLSAGKRLLAEGANAALLDIDFGTYPYVTSSSTTAGGACTGLGIPPRMVSEVIGVVKAYTTRVGGGPFVTELNDDIGNRLREKGVEFGTTTGRPRRCGWLDLQLLRYSHALNGYSALNVTKLDVLTGLESIQVCIGYSIEGKKLGSLEFPAHAEDLERVKAEYITVRGWHEDISSIRDFTKLPVAAQDYLRLIEREVGVPVAWIGVGPGRDHMIWCP